MKAAKEDKQFAYIREYFLVYLPEQRKVSPKAVDGITIIFIGNSQAVHYSFHCLAIFLPEVFPRKM